MLNTSSLTPLLTKAKLLYLVAFALGLFHLLVAAGMVNISTMPMRLIHVLLAFSLLFSLKPVSRQLEGTRFNTVLSALLILAVLIASVWLISRWKAIAFSGGETETADFYAGAILIALVFEAARRGIGLILALITLLFFSYPFISPYLPGVLHGRGYSVERIVTFLTTDTQGVYGIPVGVSASYIIVFTIFGALLSGFGAGDFFFEISVRITRGLRAASAKSAVLFSTLIGMVSGSAAGNVAVTGTVTIPVMKREGYEPHQAGAIEAVASTGGQLMPPVMGAAAFIMAEIVGVPYTSVMSTALLPALLFFGSIFVIVHLQAVQLDIKPTMARQDDGRPLLTVLLQGLPFIATFATLITLMLAGYSPINKVGWTAASYAITSFILPFAFCFGPGLLLQGSSIENLMAILTGFAGITAIAVIGCMITPLSLPLRMAAATAGLCLLFQGWWTAIVGAVLLVGLLMYQRTTASASPPL